MPSRICIESGSSIPDGDKGDITTSGNGAVWTVDPNAITYAKIQDVSATDKILGRSTAGAGDIEEIAFTSAARALADDSTADAMLGTLIAQKAISRGRLVAVGETYLSLPGVTMQTISTHGITANQDRYFPILVDTTMMLDQLVTEVTTLAVLSTLRMGIYNADTDWVPGSLVLDAGTVDVSSTGVKTISISQILTPGRYLLVLNSNGAPGLRALRGMVSDCLITAALGSATTFARHLIATRVYAAFPGTGTAITAITQSSTTTEYVMFVRKGTP